MKDYTTNNYCDFLWINDLQELKKNEKNTYTVKVKKNNSSITFDFVNVIIFGTIVEIKPIGSKGFLYHVDDGTGVIICKHSGDQFEEILSMIEREQSEILNQSFQMRQLSEQSSCLDSSAEDSIFNDKSLQAEDIEINKRNQIMELHSLWNNIYESFSSLLCQYNIGDSVSVHGKLYSYFNINQIYVNSIRLMSLSEEMVRVGVKLENGFDPVSDVRKFENEQKRLSGLMTFDHIHHLSARFPSSRDIQTPKKKEGDNGEKVNKVVTPCLGSTMTFDTFDGNMC